MVRETEPERLIERRQTMRVRQASYDRRSSLLRSARLSSEELLGGPQFGEALRQSEAISTARVQQGPYIGFLTEDEARTITVLDQQVRNRETTEPRMLRTRVELYLIRTVNGWRVDRVQINS